MKLAKSHFEEQIARTQDMGYQDGLLSSRFRQIGYMSAIFEHRRSWFNCIQPLEFEISRCSDEEKENQGAGRVYILESGAFCG
jgi:hypothetical protein